MIIISKLSEVFSFPVFLLFLISFFYFFKRQNRFTKTYIVLLCIFSLGFRSLYTIQSRRYYSVFLLFGLILIGYLFNNLLRSKKKYLVVILVSFFSSYQLLKAFNSTSNLTEFSIQETINKEKIKLRRYSFLSPQRVFRRYNSFADTEFYSDDEQQGTNDLKNIIDKYLYYQSDFLILNTNKINYSSFDINGFRVTDHIVSLAGFSFGKGKKNKYSIVRIFSPIDSEQFFYDEGTNNLIINGNMEKQIAQPEIKKRLRYWAEKESDFYSKPDLLLPNTQILLEGSWRRDEIVPEVYSDDKDPISGAYSLHVSSSIPMTLYFFNRIKPHSGYLSFKIRSFIRNTSFTLKRIDYDNNNKMVYSSRFNRIRVFDNETHSFQFYFDKNDFVGETSLFYLLVDSADFLIDDISFIPTES